MPRWVSARFPPPADKIKNPTAVFSGLDKITGRIVSFEVAVDETVQFGALQLTPRVCYTRPPTESAKTTAFLEVDEVTLENKYRASSPGWMFASSPGLHAIEHPIYDVWLVDCKGGTDVTVEAKEQEDVPAMASKPEKAKRAGRDKDATRTAQQVNSRRAGRCRGAARRAGAAAPEAVARILPVERGTGAGAPAAAAAIDLRRDLPLSLDLERGSVRKSPPRRCRARPSTPRP